jgi:hypothetical protein
MFICLRLRPLAHQVEYHSHKCIQSQKKSIYDIKS